MIELGKYAETVLTAYAVSLALLIAIVLFSWRKNNAVRRKLMELEHERDG